MQYDSVALNTFWSRLISICDEAEAGVIRTAFSLVIRESRDFCCCLLDPKGDCIAQGSLGIAVFAGCIPLIAKEVLQRVPAETLEPGDVVINNNPWENSGHLYDIFALEPIFYKGKLVALAGSVVHWPDIGGRGPMPDNRSIFEEGLLLWSVKIAKKGQFNEEVLQIIRDNVRYPDEVMGDFNSQLVGNNLMRNKLIELIEMQGIADFGTLSETILSRSEGAMREAVAKIPDGDFEGEIEGDGIDGDFTVKVSVSVRGTDIHVDYTGTSPQSEWSINSMPLYSKAQTLIGIKALVAPHLPNNSGQMRPVTVTMPLGTIVNPRPRSVGAASRTVLGDLCLSAVYAALAKALPERLQAETRGCTGAFRIQGVDDYGRLFEAVLLHSSGMGGRYSGDGPSGVAWPSTITSTPTEVQEYVTPALLVERVQLRPDSGGPGRHRGGCGVEYDVRIMGKASGACLPKMKGTMHQARGLLGGHPGEGGNLAINGSPLPAMRTFDVRGGDLISVKMDGGGGVGDPLERDPALVLEDVISGLVSPEQADASYGVALDMATERVDWEGTKKLRGSRPVGKWCFDRRSRYAVRPCDPGHHLEPADAPTD
ncbi:MAG: hydantoinase B/oxoprolinase family protein [Chloroflexi bacterium]|nr:hydantoinase B/oxoprolinase family protein [Chloroflexota bacterium]